MQESPSFQVYNASAGSGKTFTLVKEYLKILLKTTDAYRFQNILAITFTNKAAAEMKERVLKSLHDFSEGFDNSMLEILEEELDLSQDEILKRSKKVLTSILQNYSAFNITTIDSFTHRIIRSFAFDLGLSLNFDVEMDAGSILDEAVDVLISKIGQDKKLTEVLIEYSIDKSDDDKSWDISNDLKEFSRILLNENHFSQIKSLKSKNLDDYSLLKKRLKKEVRLLKSKLNDLGNQGLEIIENKGLNHNDFYSSMFPKHLLKLSADVENAKFFDQSKLKERIKANSFYAKSKPEEIKQSIEEILPSLLDLYGKSEKLYQKLLLSELVLKSVIPLAVLSQINSTLDDIKEQNNIRLNAEFNQLIAEQIKNEPAPFIYERIGEKFKYYFIDEMQDTSELQWKNLIPLIENSLSSESLNEERGSLMLVGDAKQAIYRWRGGKAEQFIDLAQNSENNEFSVQKKVQTLDTNYRSSSQIISFNNQFFTHVSEFLGNEEYKKMYVSGNSQLSSIKDEGYVEVSLLNIDKDDPEKELIYPKEVRRIIENLDSNFSKKDVCILVRTKKQGIAISDYLTQNNIPIISSETLLLKNNEVVDFLIDIFTTIYNPSNKKAIANALYYIGEKKCKSDKLHQFLKDRINKPISEIFDSLQEADCNFSEKEFTKLPFYDAVEYTLRSFNLIDHPNLYVQSFLDFVLEYEQKRGNGLSDFLEHWERKKDGLSVVLSEGQEAVQIMTIHKSKGLEFPVVIFPYDLEIYREQKPKIWYNELKEEDGFSINSSLIDYSKRVRHTSDYGEFIYNQRREEIQLDNLNLLYVALTRPKEQLYIVTKNNDSLKGLDSSTTYSDLFLNFLDENGNSMSESNSGVKYEFGNQIRSSNFILEKSKESKEIFQERFISNSWLNKNISVATNSSKLWDTDQGQAIAYGNLIHNILSYVIWEPDIENVLDKFLIEGNINKETLIEIKPILNSIVNHPELSKYYRADPEVQIISENEILSIEGNVQIPDRIWIKDKNVVIIDYKTGIQKEYYHTQINEYGNTLREMGYKIEKKLLIYIDSKVLVKEVV